MSSEIVLTGEKTEISIAPRGAALIVIASAGMSAVAFGEVAASSRCARVVFHSSMVRRSAMFG
eukprot:346166-Rhodomonas_salina.1